MRNYIVLLIVSVLLTACGGGSAGGGNPSGLSIPVGTVSGTTFDGLISSANLSVYDFSAGTKGALLTQAVSDAAGQYSISLKVESRPILIEITGGSYFEEAGEGNQIALKSSKLSALMNYTAGETIKTAVTTFTHLAAGLAVYEIGKGTSVAAAINDANGRVTAMVGFNILTTQPVQITDQINANSILAPELKYGFLAGAISMWTYNHGPDSFVHTLPYTSIDFAQLLYQDISADGLLDGVGLDNAGAKAQLVFGGTPLNADVYRLGIGLGLVQIASDKNNKTRQNGASLLDYAKSYAASTDLMFDNATPSAIAAPEVKIASPADGLWMRGMVTVATTVKSDVGISQAEILVDGGVVSTTSANPTVLTAQLDTTQLSDGQHTIVVNVTDLGGVKSVATSKINIDNTPPSLSINAPLVNSWLKGVVGVTTTVQSSVALSKAELLVDGNLVSTTTTNLTSPAFQFDTTLYNDGAHTISVQTTNLGGSQSTSVVQVNIDNTPPVVKITVPHDTTFTILGHPITFPAWTRKSTVIAGTVTSAAPISKVDLIVNNATVATTFTSLATPQFTFDTKTLPDGNYTIQLRATDAGGLVTTVSGPLHIDNTPPTMATAMSTTLACGPSTTIFPKKVICSGTAADNLSGVSSLSTPANSHSTVANGQTYPLTYVDAFTASWTLEESPSTMWLMRVMDAAGNCSDYGYSGPYATYYDGDNWISGYGFQLAAVGTCP